MKHSTFRIFSAILFSFSLILLAQGGVVSYAQTDASSNQEGVASKITFPVAELGGCKDKAECKSYCDNGDNAEACIAFGKAHGLLNKEEADRGQKFTAQLKQKGGPGGCKSPIECEAFCSNVANVEACIAFAKTNNLKPPKLAEAEKFASYLKSGGTMPGGCTDQASCKTYCSELKNAEECHAFAQKAGVGTKEGNKENLEKAKKFGELAKKGETPGGCATGEACKNYCEDSSHREECINFAKKAGVLSLEQADKFQALGGKGPGGCDSPESCQAYCNDQTHRDECFAFAKEHNLIPKEKLENAERGLVTFRTGLSNASPEVLACLESTLGEEIISSIQSGTLTPGPEIGEKAKSCFEKFSKKFDPANAIQNLPGTVRACFKEKLGDDFASVNAGKIQMTPEMGDALRVCHEQQKFLMREGNVPGKPNASPTYPKAPSIIKFLESAPPQIGSCIKEKLGSDLATLQAGGEPSLEMRTTVEACFKQFKPASPRMMDMQNASNTKRIPQNVPQRGQVRYFPEPMILCLKNNLSGEALELVLRGGKPDASTEGIVQKCYMTAKEQQNIAPKSGDVPTNTQPGGTLPAPTTARPYFPPAVLECLKSRLPVQDFESVLRGVKPNENAGRVLMQCYEMQKLQNSVTPTNILPPKEMNTSPESGTGTSVPPPPPPPSTNTVSPTSMVYQSVANALSAFWNPILDF